MLLLPVCESAVRVREFIKLHSRYEYGMVSHALCAALKKVMREFDILIAQLEVTFAAGKLSLQKMVYLLQPSRVTLSLLEKLAARLKDVVGGKMLDMLHAAMLEQGDVKSRDLHLHLLNKAAEPFLDTLSTWIFRYGLPAFLHFFLSLRS
jgi:gamma-tubulin complex component 2